MNKYKKFQTKVKKCLKCFNHGLWKDKIQKHLAQLKNSDKNNIKSMTNYVKENKRKYKKSFKKLKINSRKKTQKKLLPFLLPLIPTMLDL